MLVGALLEHFADGCGEEGRRLAGVYGVTCVAYEEEDTCVSYEGKAGGWLVCMA